MARGPSCEEKGGLKKGAWTADEDQKLSAFIEANNGHGSWRTLPQLAGLQRCGKSCRLRWTNYLRPNIKRGNFSLDEEETITHLHAMLGNKWSTIASHLPGRTDNEVKNHWNTRIKKRLTRLGIDPTTHRSITFLHASYPLQKAIQNGTLFVQDNRNHTNPLSKPVVAQTRPHVNLPLPDKSFVSHMAQWELARLEAEARLAATSTTLARGLGASLAALKPSSGGRGAAVVQPLDCWNSTSSSSSAAGSSKLQIHGSHVRLKESANFLEPLSVALCKGAAGPPDKNTISLPSLRCMSSSGWDAMTTPRESPITDDADELQLGSTASSALSCPADARSASDMKGATSTTPQLPEEQLDQMISCGPTYDDHDMLQAPDVSLFDLINIIPASPDQACEAGPASYWARVLLDHGLPAVTASSSLSSCPLKGQMSKF